VLLEFPPVMAEGKLFLLKNNGALHAINKRTGKAVWKRKLGVLAAASPAYGNGRVFATLLARGHPIDVATHDSEILEGVRARVDSVPGGWSRVEFQMLYGVRRDLQRRFAGQGYPVRVYIPYGTDWYPYLTRRLAERPANLWFFLSNLARVR
jgi:hypothetical protein